MMARYPSIGDHGLTLHTVGTPGTALGFAAPRDPIWISTLDAMDRELVSDSLVYRYNPAASPDGLAGGEGTGRTITAAHHRGACFHLGWRLIVPTSPFIG